MELAQFVAALNQSSYLVATAGDEALDPVDAIGLIADWRSVAGGLASTLSVCAPRRTYAQFSYLIMIGTDSHLHQPTAQVYIVL